MRKKLAVVGNSLALVIDKTLRRMMKLSPTLEVDVNFDGVRLIVTPVSPDDDDDERATCSSFTEAADAPLSLAMVLDADNVAKTLARRFDISQERFAQLAPGYGRVGAYMGWASFDFMVKEANATERALVRRMKFCCEQLLQGASWPDAISAALRAFPLPGVHGDLVITA